MQTERRVAANPQTKPTDLGCESADKWLLTSTSTVAICMMIVGRKGGEIVRTISCCIVCYSSAQWYAHTCDQFLLLTVGFRLSFLLDVFVILFLYCLLLLC